MNRYILFFTTLFALSSGIALSQNQEVSPQSQKTGGFARPNLIKSGFYLKIGPVFPMGSFAYDLTLVELPPYPPDTSFFPGARTGGNLGMGYLIYIGPAIANNHLRFGIDACFIDAWFATSKPNLPVGSSKTETEFWYYFFGQKFGPLITVNPVDRLMIDLSYKLDFNISWHNSDWGYHITGQEMMMNVRYRFILVGLHYTMGTINYNDFDDSRPVHDIDVSTFRVLIGFKF